MRMARKLATPDASKVQTGMLTPTTCART